MPEIIKSKRTFLTALTLIVMLGVAETAPAQTTRAMKRKAEASFQNKDYYSSAKWYAAILYDSPLVNKTTTSLVYPFQPLSRKHARKIKPADKAEMQFKLAESYRLFTHFKDAVPQYEQYIASQDTRFPLARLWYGISLLANDQPEKASTVLTAFLQKYRPEDSLKQKARQAIADCSFAVSNKSQPPRAIISKIPATASADGSNFALEKRSDDSYFFTTSRNELTKKQEKIFPVRLYTTNLKTGSVEKMTAIPGDLNMGTSSLSADGQTLFFTGWKEDKSSKTNQYRLYSSTKNATDGKWSMPAALASSVNVPGYNAKHPFITKDNKYLLFVSDQPGGYGKDDIWMIALENGNPIGTAINLGNQINTKEQEASPFYDAVTGELYFSSNGRTGMGGMDIYKISGNLSANNWKESAMNMGYPVNSVKDDLYYTKESNTDNAYLSSDRASNCCMEIFKAVNIVYKDSSSKKEMVVTPFKPPVTAEDSLGKIQRNQKRWMDSINAITLNRMHVNYRFASARIRREDYPQLAEVIQQMEKNPSLNLLVASFTDCIGPKAANERLSRKRSESVKAYLVAKGIAATRVNIDFFGKQHFIVACKEDSSYNTARQMANRRSDLMITTEKNPKWIPTGNELDLKENTNKVPTYTVDGTDKRKLANEIALSKPARSNPSSQNIVENRKQLKDSVPASLNSNEAAKEEKRSRPVTGLKNADADKAMAATKEPATTGSKFLPKTKTTDSANRNSKNRVLAGSNAVAMKSGRNVVANTKQKTKPVKTDSEKITARPLVKTIQPESRITTNRKGDSLHTMKINALLDFTPRLKTPTLIDQMTSRTPKRSFEVLTTSDSVKVELYDNGIFDNDSVSVIYNKQLVIYQQMLQTNKPITFWVKLNPDLRKNEMIFFAENLGLTPPNSALMIITDGDRKRTEINVSSDLQNNAVIYFIKVKK
ncbi:MAG: OmpA family protein [Bacteroidota bacterium]